MERLKSYPRQVIIFELLLYISEGILQVIYNYVDIEVLKSHAIANDTKVFLLLLTFELAI